MEHGRQLMGPRTSIPLALISRVKEVRAGPEIQLKVSVNATKGFSQNLSGI